jgi:hypothetical protein
MLFDGNVKRTPLMERDGSGVSALVGLDGFVVVRAGVTLWSYASSKVRQDRASVAAGADVGDFE